MSRVLLVEDEEDLRFLVRLALEHSGHVVTDVESAEDARAHLTEHDVLLLDIRLPGISGLDLLREHIANGGTAPAVIMSAHADQQTRDDALGTAARAMLNKPFHMQTLLDAIEGVAT